MSYDIYGNRLRRGHCEVHPHVHEEYPCSVCMQETNNRNAQSESDYYEIKELKHELELSHQRIGELEQRESELAATVDRLLVFDMTPEEYHRMTSSERYKQNLNEVKREAVMEFTKYCTNEIERLYGWVGAVIEAESIIKGLTLTADQLYPRGE